MTKLLSPLFPLATMFLLVPLTFAGTMETINLDVDGQRRHFTLFTPNSYDPAVPMPLVFGLHGFTSDANQHQLITNLHGAAERHGALVAYPQAVGNDWFPGHVPGNNIDYLVAVYDAIVANRNVNKEIVGLSGFSQGANMSLTLASARPDLFSSVVSVAGTRFYTPEGELVPANVPEVPTRPISRLHVHGNADPFGLFDGGQVLDFPLYNPSVTDSVANWAVANGFRLPDLAFHPVEDRTEDGLMSLLADSPGSEYKDIHGQTHRVDTQLITVVGGGHNWPGDFDFWPDEFQPVTRDFSTSDLAMRFMLSHPREYIPGDFTRNGVLDVDDINMIIEGAEDALLDLTGDGMTDKDDRAFWATELFGTYVGDADLDGEFNSSDFIAVFQAGKYESGVEAGWNEGDWDGNGVFDSGDFIAAFQGGGYEQGPRAGVSAVPEPSGLFGTLLALAGVVTCWRRRFLVADVHRPLIVSGPDSNGC